MLINCASYEFELALKTECGYRDSLPYWDIKRTSPSNLLNSTIFSPSPSGFGGNGAYDPTALIQWLWIPAQGGGCIQSGPFKDVVIHIGPGNSTAYTERCIKRNIFPRAAERWMTKEEEERLYKLEEYEVFQDTLQGAIDFDTNLGVHNGGHLVVSGEVSCRRHPNFDPIFSPSC